VSYRDLEQMMGECGISVKTAYARIKGFEVMHDIRGEVRIVERAFGLGASVVAEAVQIRCRSRFSLSPAPLRSAGLGVVGNADRGYGCTRSG
jgi:hypothetical protein